MFGVMGPETPMEGTYQIPSLAVSCLPNHFEALGYLRTHLDAAGQMVVIFGLHLIEVPIPHLVRARTVPRIPAIVICAQVANLVSGGVIPRA